MKRAYDALTKVVEQRPQGDAGHDLIYAGTPDVSADRYQFCPSAFLSAPLAEPRRALAHDARHGAQSFDIIDHGWLAEQAMCGREWRLDPRETTLAFNRFEEGGFLTADVCAAATPDLDLKAKVTAQDIVAQQPGGNRFIQRGLHRSSRFRVFATDKQIASLRADG